MSKYELSLSKNYVPDWGIVEAVRELFQNALDQETTEPDNAMFFDYNPATLCLKIGNKASVLDVQTLLIGSSSKRDDEKTIGKHGEGYKVATLVLLRENKAITFYNYGKREIWATKLVKARRYGGALVPTFFVNKVGIWKFDINNNLTIEINGITPDEYAKISEFNLHITKPVEVLNTSMGRILLDKQYVGKVFVNGLFVCNHNDYTYGYDFKPQHIRLDRDRKLVSDFDLRWLSSRMWAAADAEKTVELAKKGVADVSYVYAQSSLSIAQCTKAYSAFKQEHGSNAVPVTTQAELTKLTDGYKPVIVNGNYKQLLEKAEGYEKPKEDIQKLGSIKEQLTDWISRAKAFILMDLVDEFEQILDRMED